METLRIEIEPRTAFGGTLRGDTLFGQLCWALRNRFGKARLEALLQDYRNRPFTVCSDGFPHGFVPRPVYPLHRFAPVEGERKRVKGLKWLSLEAAGRPVREWLHQCLPETALAGPDSGGKPTAWHEQPHNSIHRQTGTTQGAEFAPYTQRQWWPAPGWHLDVWCLFDPDRIERTELETCLEDIGRLGYGRDATIGLGKFVIHSLGRHALPHQDGATHCFTLAPTAPQGLGFDVAGSHYSPFTRFGRHGDQTVLTGRPFKNPVLLADTGALLRPATLPSEPVIGQGLGGDGSLSRTMECAVHQGYAPCIFVRLEAEEP